MFAKGIAPTPAIPEQMMSRLFPILLFLSFTQASAAQRSSYWETELMLGKAVPHLSDFPKNSMNVAGQITWGHWRADAGTGWQAFFNRPQYGLQTGWNWLGNSGVFGHQFSLMPFVAFSTARDWRKGVRIRLAMGPGYSTGYFDGIHNPENKLIGSPWVWSVHGGIYKSWEVAEAMRMNVGLGFQHYSNGHTTIPNYGVNTMQALFALQYFPGGTPETATERRPYKASRRRFSITVRQNWGFHELGGAASPVGGDDFSVYTSSLAAGMDWRKFVRFRLGVSYRFYESYYTYIQSNNLRQYAEHPKWSASSFTFFGGAELLMGHVGAEVELGFNLYKPFYKTHFEVFEKTNTYDKITKRVIAARMGAQVYLFNHNRQPKHNAFVGAHINANMGQADFTDFTVGYVLLLMD